MTVRILTWFILFPLLVIAVVFAVGNRGEMTFDFYPLPLTLALPVYAGIFIAVFFGFIAGGTVCWLSQGRWRRLARQRKRRIAELERDLIATQTEEAKKTPSDKARSTAPMVREALEILPVIPAVATATEATPTGGTPDTTPASSPGKPAA